MKERGILFSAAMVNALLAGQKTQTRRIVKRQPEGTQHWERQVAALTCIDAKPGTHFWRPVYSGGIGAGCVCPYGQPGDRLWVRERLVERPDGWHYVADEAPVVLPDSDPRVPEMVAWAHHKQAAHCVSIHMPRFASRIILEIAEVRIERLQAITPDDAIAEGAVDAFSHQTSPPPRGQGRTLEEHQEFSRRALKPGRPSLVGYFAELWNEINGDRAPWSSNPWVWVVSFGRVGAARAA